MDTLSDDLLKKSTAAALSPSSTDATNLDWEHLAPGERWRGAYQIGEQLPDSSQGKTFKAVHVGAVMEVTIRCFRVSDDMRTKVWERMAKTKHPGLVELVEAVEFEGRRVEVIRTPPATTLREWGAGRKASQAEIEQVLAQLYTALVALHEAGVAHLNLKPEKVHVATSPTGLQLLLGGLELATLIDQRNLVPIQVNPFYAPPEAVGLFQHSPGRGLKAWDWWSIGRILQELTLGRHVIGHILERDVSRQTPELSTRAESLLAEKEEGSPRAGAVEAMPAMDRELTALLKGLLSSCRDVRWGQADVKRWQDKETVKERYALPRNERLFIWKERAYTVPEAAELFSGADNWADGLANLFDPTNSATLVFFMAEVVTLSKIKEKLDLILKIADSPALKETPKPVRIDVVACLAWGHLAAGTFKPRLRGREIDAKAFKEFLRPESLPDGLATVRTLLLRSVLQNLDQQDGETGRWLIEYDKIASAALALAKNNRWIDPAYATDTAQIMTLCLEPDAALHRIRESMHKNYACTREPALEKIFKKQGPTLPELVILAFTNGNPLKYEYLTHVQWSEEQYRMLSERGARLSAAITWINLETALRTGPMLFGQWRTAVILWPILALIVVLTKQWLIALALAIIPIGLSFCFKYAWLYLNRKTLEKHLPPGKPWHFWDGAARCRREALAALNTASAPSLATLKKSLREVNQDISRIDMEPKPKKVDAPGRFMGAWFAVAASWILAFGALGGTTLTVIKHPPKLPKFVTSVVTSKFESDKNEPIDRDSPKGQKEWGVNKKAREEAEEAAAEVVSAEDQASIDAAKEELRKMRAEYEAMDKPAIKVAWDFKKPNSAQLVKVRSSADASNIQTRTAEEAAAAMLARFDAKTIDTIIAVRVPTGSGVALMLYDGKAGRLVNRTVVKIGAAPLPRSWLEIGDQVVFYLGTE